MTINIFSKDVKIMIDTVLLILKYSSLLCLLIIAISFLLFKLLNISNIKDDLKDKLCNLFLYISFISTGVLSICLLFIGLIFIIDWINGIFK